MSIEVTFEGDAGASLNRMSEAVDRAVPRATFVAAGALIEGVRRASPVLTGALRDSHDSVDPLSGGRFVVASDLVYSEIIQRRTNYLNVGLSFVLREMEAGVAKTLEEAIEKAA